MFFSEGCQILHYELLFVEALVARNDTTGRQPGHLRPANRHVVSLEADPPLIKSGMTVAPADMATAAHEGP